jgi:hypothetical protein
MPTHLSPDPTLPRPPIRGARAAGFLLLAALAAAGCSDQTAPTSPDADGGAVSGGAADAKRAPFISDMQLQSSVVYVDDGVAYVQVSYELTNPGGKTGGLHIDGSLRQGSFSQGTDYAMIGCGDAPGRIGHGTCRASTLLEIPAAGLQYGSAQFTLTLSRVVSNVATALDSRTANVFIIPI